MNSPSIIGRLRGRDVLLLTAAALLAVLVGWGLPRALPAAGALENWLADFRFAALANPVPADPRIVIVAITEDTLAGLPYRSPLDREFLAGLIKDLGAAGVKSIGLDLLIDQPTEPAKDRRLHQAIRNSPAPVIVAAAGVSDGLTQAQADYLADFTNGLTTGRPNLVTDRIDGTVRWIFVNQHTGGPFAPGIAAVLAAKSGAEVPQTNVRLDYRPMAEPDTLAFPTFPAHTVSVLPKTWLAGKIVLIGADLTLQDRHRTPFAAAWGNRAGSLPGIVIQAHALSQLLDGRSAPVVSVAEELLLLAALAVAGAILAILHLSFVSRSVILAFAAVGYTATTFGLYPLSGLPLPILGPGFAFALAFGGGIAALGHRDRDQKRFIRQAFARYLSPVLVEQLADDPSKLKVGGERRVITYVFTDLASFTSLTERIEPEVLVSLLNEYIDGMCAIAFRHEATLDKIVGDAVALFFNAPLDQPDHRQRAVACALELDDFGQEFVARHAKRGIEIGITRIGINTGPAIIGNFGGTTIFDYTGHGDAVNTAARLESVNKHLGTRICVSAETAAACKGLHFRPVGKLILKGKTVGLDVVEPLSEARAADPATTAYREAYAALERGDQDAMAAFQRVLALDSEDPLAALHLARLRNGDSGVTIVMGEK